MSDINFSTLISGQNQQGINQPNQPNHSIQERIDRAISYDFVSTDRDVFNGLTDEHPIVRRRWLERDDFIMTPDMIQIASLDNDPQNQHILKNRLKLEKAYLNAGGTSEGALWEKSWRSLTLHSLNIKPDDLPGGVYRGVNTQRHSQYGSISSVGKLIESGASPSGSIHSQRPNEARQQSNGPIRGPIRRKKNQPNR